MKNLFCFIVSVWCFASPVNSQSQPLGQFPFFQHHSLLRKNEPVHVNAIFQDKTGYMWFGTNKGLFKFDGINQKRFRIADGLPDENVTAIAQDSDGKIWIGHKNGRIAFIEKGTIKNFDPREGSASQEVSHILFDKKGNLWFSTLGDGLYYFMQKRLFRLDETDNMPDLFVYDIAEDKNGNLWVSTDRGAAIVTLKGNSVTLKTVNYKNGLPDNIIKKLVMDAGGTVWMGTEDAGIINYNPITGQCKQLMREWTLGTLTDFLFTQNQVWISTEKGIAVFDRNTQQLKLYDATVEAAFASINNLFQDNEQNIWIGTSSGVTRTPGDHIEYIETLEPSKNTNIVAMAIDKQGSLWFSNSDGLFKRKTSTSRTIVNELQLVKTPFEKHTVMSLFVDEDGYVWAGLYGEGVIRINPVTGNIRYLKKELRDGNVLNITGKNHVVWLATLGGVTEIKISGEQLTTKNYSSGDGLASDFIYQVFIDSKNRAWFATDGKGVAMKDAAGFHHYTNGLNSKVVYGFAEDGEGKIWVNVQGDGIYQFDGRKFQLLGSTRLRDNNVHCLSSDKSGNLVVMHNLGIDIYDVKKDKIQSYGDEIGIHDKIPNLNATAKDEQGRIFFGTDQGIIIYADEMSRNQSAPLPVIDGLKVLNQNVDLGPNLNFKYNQNNFTINYLGFWYRNPSNLNYQYKLDNYDVDWISSRNHSVIYSSLPPGNYTFRLRTSDTEVFNDGQEASFSFVVLSPFWKTAWFIITITLSVALLVYVYIKFRERALRKDKEVLEAINTELKKTNSELDKFVYSVSHDLRAPLTSIIGVADICAEETENPFLLKHLNMMKGSVLKLDSFISDILDYSRNSRLEVRKEEINFKEVLEEITGNLKYMSGNQQKLNLKVNINEQAAFQSDKRRISVVLNNIISNAIRYKNPTIEDPMVAIDVDLSDTEACIVVKDNGIGISPENQRKIFDMFYRVSESSVGSGLGLYIVKETIDKLNGSIKVESEIGKGTAFSIQIPNK